MQHWFIVLFNKDKINFMSEELVITQQAALEYHQKNQPGKIAITATKNLKTQQDLALAYSPGVAVPCLEIAKDPHKVYDYTAKGNFVAVISNGTAVLGLGNLGAAASKPVMEGKAVLFKRFADIDSIDIEVSTEDPTEFINSIKYLGASWGGVNLEDIKAPECFIIEDELKKLMDIPIFHDDQHGTAIITAAGLINAAHLTKRKLEDMKIVINGAGAAGIACAQLLKDMGAKPDNVILCDTKGVIYQGREFGMNKWKEQHAVNTKLRSLEEALVGADVFLGLSVKGAINQDMVKSMDPQPIIFAMANPDPEISPQEVKEVAPNAIMATGRSDYNNQVNNVMGFPYIFRGALDVQATTINQEMKIAAAKALAQLARKSVPDEVSKAYSGRKMRYSADYIIPVPFDPRLITTIPVAVAKAAMDTGVARKHIDDFKAYREQLEERLNPTANAMNLMFEQMHSNPQRIIFADGEEEEVIKAAVSLRHNNYAFPILLGRANRILEKLEALGEEYTLEGIEVINAAVTDKLEGYSEFLYKKLQRKGYLKRDCDRLVKTDRNAFAACVVACSDADALVTGLSKSYYNTLEDISKIIDKKKNSIIFSYSMMTSKNHNFMIADNTIHEIPTSAELAEIAIGAAGIMRNSGEKPRVALLSFSNFGNPMKQKAERIREAVKILEEKKVDFEFDGEITPDIALNAELLKLYPFCRLKEPANVLIMPALHTASISSKLLQEIAGSSIIGPILTGLQYPVQILPMGASASEIINFSAFAAIEALGIKKRASEN